MRVFVAVTPTDMRKSFSGLAVAVRGVVAEDPLSGHLFVFFNWRKTMMNSIYWDGGGYCLMAKQLARGTFVLPTANERGVVELGASELALDTRRHRPVECTTTAAATRRAPGTYAATCILVARLLG